MVIGPGAPENGAEHMVFRGHGAQLPGRLQLTHAGRGVFPGEEHIAGDVAVQIVQRAHAHRSEHLGALGGGGWDVATHCNLFPSQSDIGRLGDRPRQGTGVLPHQCPWAQKAS